MDTPQELTVVTDPTQGRALAFMNAGCNGSEASCPSDKDISNHLSVKTSKDEVRLRLDPLSSASVRGKATLDFDGNGSLRIADLNGHFAAAEVIQLASTRSSKQADDIFTDGAFNEDFVKNCGRITCTRYYTRSATKRMNERLQRQINKFTVWGEAGPAISCAAAGAALGVLGAGPGIVVGAATGAAICDRLGAAKIGSIIDHLQGAANANQCFAVRTPKGFDRIGAFALYSSNYLIRSNEFCRD